MEKLVDKLLEEIRKLDTQRVSANDYLRKSIERKDWLGVTWAGHRLFILEKQILFLEELAKNEL